MFKSRLGTITNQLRQYFDFQQGLLLPAREDAYNPITGSYAGVKIRNQWQKLSWQGQLHYYPMEAPEILDHNENKLRLATQSMPMRS